MVGGRLISTLELHDPLHLKLRAGHEISISVLEVPSPKLGSNYDSGLEHVEFVVSEPLSEFMIKFPMKWDISALNKDVNADIRLVLDNGSSVKFHNASLKDVIRQEINRL